MGCDGRGRARQSEARRSARSLQHRQRGVGGQRLPLGPDRGEPEGEGLAEPYPPARRTQSSAVRAPEVGEHDALEGARPCRARIRPAAELDGRQDRAHHRHRASEIQDRHDEPRLQHPPAGSARAGGSCTRLSALTGGLRVASCKGPRGRRPGVKTVPDRGLTSARALQPLPKGSIVRGSHKSIFTACRISYPIAATTFLTAIFIMYEVARPESPTQELGWRANAWRNRLWIRDATSE